jgi:hypothetical protein
MMAGLTWTPWRSDATGNVWEWEGRAEATRIIVGPAEHAYIVGLQQAMDRIDKENVQLRAEINGTEWENDLLANAPEHFDGDEAQSEIVTRYVHALDALADACRAYFDNPMEVTVNPVLAALDAVRPGEGR